MQRTWSLSCALARTRESNDLVEEALIRCSVFWIAPKYPTNVLLFQQHRQRSQTSGRDLVQNWHWSRSTIREGPDCFPNMFDLILIKGWCGEKNQRGLGSGNGYQNLRYYDLHSCPHAGKACWSSVILCVGGNHFFFKKLSVPLAASNQLPQHMAEYTAWL